MIIIYDKILKKMKNVLENISSRRINRGLNAD